MLVTTPLELADVVLERVVKHWLSSHPGWSAHAPVCGRRSVTLTLDRSGKTLVLGIEPKGSGPAAFTGPALAVSALGPPPDSRLFDDLARAIAALELSWAGAEEDAQAAPSPSMPSRAAHVSPSGETRVAEGGVLYNTDRRERAFHVVNLGLPKTGTTTVAAMFRNWRSAHEFWSEPVAEVVQRRAAGDATEHDVLEVLRARERAGRLELDSASFLHTVVEQVVALYPTSKYVFPVRPFDAWLDSLLGMLARQGISEAEPWAPWEKRILSVIFGDFQGEWFRKPGAVSITEPALVQTLQYWLASVRRCLDALPRGSLVFPTSELDAAAPALAALAGVPVESVVTAHENIGNNGMRWWRALPEAFRAEADARSAPVLATALGFSQRESLPWRDLHACFPALALLERHADEIRAEADAIAEHDYSVIPVNERVRCRWMVYRLVLGADARRFPGADAEARKRCPKTLAVLDQIPNVERAAFALLAPGTELEPHTDPRDDDMVRLHLGLHLPAEERERWPPGTARVLDVRERHGARNPGPGPRVTLLVDQKVGFGVPNGAIPSWGSPNC